MRTGMGWVFRVLCRWEVGVRYCLRRSVTANEIKFNIYFVLALDYVLLERLSVGFANKQTIKLQIYPQRITADAVGP